MIKLSAPDGSEVSIDGKLVQRIRQIVSGEDPDAKTRIDWAIMSLVKESPDEVARLVKKELPSLAVLAALEGWKVWFNAKQAVGPLPITPSQKQSGFKSSIKIMNYCGTTRTSGSATKRSGRWGRADMPTTCSKGRATSV